MGRRRRIFLVFIVLASLALAALSVHLLQLDHQIRTRFSGVRWTLPAQVYAAPLELYPGLPLGREALREELQRLGYRQLRTAAGPGTYAQRDGGLQLVSRSFDFWDGHQSAEALRLSFAGDAIARVQKLESRKDVTLARLDPMPIGSIHPAQGEDRVLVRLADMPPVLPAGLILVEDQDFYDHIGIDFSGIARAAWANLRAGRVVQGGSTITQQLVKNFFLSSQQTWSRKANEALMAMLLSLHYSKNEVLEGYLNEVHLGQDGGRAIHGFGLASQFYFSKPITELHAGELATLIGLVKGASYYNPRRHPQRATERRNLVLRVFEEAGLISAQQYSQFRDLPLGVTPLRRGGVERYPAFVDLVRRQLKGQYRDQDLTDEGLRIFTTLDPRTQAALEAQLAGGLEQLENSRKLPAETLQGAGLVTATESGDILALVGDRNVRFAGFNRALDARRPIGSLAKPFVYLAALARPQRYNLMTLLSDEPLEVLMPHGALWAPQNYDRTSHGQVPLYEGLVRSYNLATVHLGLDVGVPALLEGMQRAGYQGNLEDLPSAILGAVDMSPLEVAQIYATLASGGYHTPLRAIREVVTKEGQPLQRYPLKVKQSLPEAPIYLLNWALEQVMIYGTGRSAAPQLPASLRLVGKTGTTDEFRDSWFAGYGGDRLGVIWVGRDDNQPAGFTGASGALQIWAGLMGEIKVRSFDPLQPAQVEYLLIDPESGLRADGGCDRTVSVPYIQPHLPERYADCAHQGEGRVLEWFKDLFGR